MAEEATKYTDVEQKAIDEGWIPQDRFDKADKDKPFISAEKYLENGSFFKKISEQKKQIQDLQSTVEGITAHQEKVNQYNLEMQKKQYEATIASLKAQKVQALDEGDHRQVVDIDEKIRATKEPEPDTPNNAVFDAWVSENSWYTEDKFLKREATLIGEQLANNEGLRGKALFDEVSSFIKEKYPQKFENKKRSEAPSVEGGSNSPQSNSKIASDKDLTPDERQVYNKFDRSGMFKNDKDGSKRKAYLKQVISLRD